MITKTKVTMRFNCSLERAFKSPILCDVSEIHTGFGFIPKVTHVTEDNNWGKPGSSKKIFVADSFLCKGGFAFVDRVMERKEKEYWVIQIDDFQSWAWGLEKFVGKWSTTQTAPDNIMVEYSYCLHSNNVFLYPLYWIFTKTIWRIYMKKVMKNVWELANRNEPYLYI